MRIVQFKGVDSGSPDCPEWHAWRALGLGGSDAAAIAADIGLIEGAPKWLKSANQLWELKTGRKEDTFRGNWATDRGKMGEPIVKAVYEEQTGNLVAPMFGEMDEWPVNRSSFDGLSLDGSLIIEIKCPGQAVHAMAKEGKVVPYYRPQICHQALTAWGHPDTWHPDHELHFVTGVPETRDIAIVPVAARKMRDMARKLLDAEQAFWKKVEAGDPIAGQEWGHLAVAWYLAKDALEKAKEAEKAAKDVLVAFGEASGKQRLEGAGVSLALETRRGAVDYKAAIAKHGPEITEQELDAFRRPDSSSWVPRILA